MNKEQEFESVLESLKILDIQEITHTLIKKKFSSFYQSYQITSDDLVVFLLTYFKPDISVYDILKQTSLNKNQILQAFKKINSCTLFQRLYLSHRTHRNFYRKINTLLKSPKKLYEMIQDQSSTLLELEVHPALFCNLRCVFCYSKGQGVYRYIHEKGRNPLTINQWKQIIEEAKDLGVSKIAISGGYEPFKAGETLGIIDHAHNLEIPIEIYTNGTIPLTSEKPVWDTLQKLTAIHLSFRGTNPETHAKVTRSTPQSYQILLENFQKLLASKKKGELEAKITVSFFVHKDNISSISEIIQLAEGVDSINFSSDNYEGLKHSLSKQQFTDLQKELHSVQPYILGYKKPVVTLNDDLWMLYQKDKNKPTNPLIQNYLCYNSFIRPTINPFGDVYRCCLVAQPNFDLKHTKLGTVDQNHSLKQILQRAISHPLYTKNCIKCNPSEKTGLIVMNKLKNDIKAGVLPEHQPYRGLL